MQTTKQTFKELLPYKITSHIDGVAVYEWWDDVNQQLSQIMATAHSEGIRLRYYKSPILMKDVKLARTMMGHVSDSNMGVAYAKVVGDAANRLDSAPWFTFGARGS